MNTLDAQLRYFKKISATQRNHCETQPHGWSSRHTKETKMKTIQAELNTTLEYTNNMCQVKSMDAFGN